MDMTTTPPHPFALLRSRLAEGPSEDDELVTVPPIRRLLQALGSDPAAAPRDIAALVRHALRYEHGQTGDAPTLWVPKDSWWPSESDWAAVGVKASPSGAGYTVRALPWRPDWLDEVPVDGVDGAASSEQQRRSDTEVERDPILEGFGHQRIPIGRSAGRTAFRSHRCAGIYARHLATDGRGQEPRLPGDCAPRLWR